MGGASETSVSATQPWTSTDGVSETQWSSKGSRNSSLQWTPVTKQELDGSSAAVENSWGVGADSSESGDESSNVKNIPPSEAVGSALRNPFSAMQQNAQGMLMSFLLVFQLYFSLFGEGF